MLTANPGETRLEPDPVPERHDRDRAQRENEEQPTHGPILKLPDQ
jgi:hypothetical protein